jgi:hypothetical protein
MMEMEGSGKEDGQINKIRKRPCAAYLMATPLPSPHPLTYNT